MTSTLENEPGLTRDGFLGGRLHLWQPARGFRSGVDAVFLAAACPARAGEQVLDLGCGVGSAALCLGVRVPGVTLWGLERNPVYADLARRNATESGQDMQVVIGDVADMPDELRAQSFDHVIANPPYFRGGAEARDPGRAASRAEDVSLKTWIDAATRRLRPGGRLTLIQRADRLRDLLAGCDERLGDMRVLPLSPRPGRAAELVLLSARKNARGPLRLLSPVILHAGERHGAEGDGYRPEIEAILREGAQFPVDFR